MSLIFQIKVRLLHESTTGDGELYGYTLLWKILSLLNNLLSIWAGESRSRGCSVFAHYLPVGRQPSQSAPSSGAGEPELILKNLTKVADPQSMWVPKNTDFSRQFSTLILYNFTLIEISSFSSYVPLEGHVVILSEVYLINSFMGKEEVITWPPVNIWTLSPKNANPAHGGGSSAFLL